MNLLLLDQPDLSVGNEVEVNTSRYPRRSDIWPPPIGRALRVGRLNGPMGTALVTRSDERVVNLRIDSLDIPAPDALPLTLLLALPRPKMLRRTLRTCTELGVKQIHLINSYRVEKSYWQSPLLAAERLREYLWAGLEQACDTVLPTVSLHRLFKPFVEDELPAIVSGRVGLIAHPDANVSFPSDIKHAATLAVGPEGGFTDYELSLLISQGFSAGSLGPRILRVETAVPTLISRLYCR